MPRSSASQCRFLWYKTDIEIPDLSSLSRIGGGSEQDRTQIGAGSEPDRSRIGGGSELTSIELVGVLKTDKKPACVVLSDQKGSMFGSSESQKVLLPESNPTKKACETHQPDMVP